MDTVKVMDTVEGMDTVEDMEGITKGSTTTRSHITTTNSTPPRESLEADVVKRRLATRAMVVLS